MFSNTRVAKVLNQIRMSPFNAATAKNDGGGIITVLQAPAETTIISNGNVKMGGNNQKKGEGEKEGRGKGENGIRLKINGKWLWLSEEFVNSHPGGPVVEQYEGADATHIFHAFHDGSQKAYKQLALIEAKGIPAEEEKDENDQKGTIELKKPLKSSNFDQEDSIVATYDMSLEKERQITLEFEKLRQKVHAEGLMRPKPFFYMRKICEVSMLMVLSFWLQHIGFYIISAFAMAICWQQLGWLTHEFCHHQPTKNRRFNNVLALMLGNVAQGFSRDWWKDKHNLHHATTNIIERDGDINLAPLLAMVPDDLGKYKTTISRLLIRLIIPYQHFYFTAMYPILRFSWTGQSLLHALTASKSKFKKHRITARLELITLLAHWSWVLVQLWLLPSNSTRIVFFTISQLGAGLLISLVVSYNHNSVPKFATNSGLLNNFAALHLLTTRNMRSSPFVDWLWGGLNFQIEHHLFPTMPRPNLARCSQLVRQFCAKTGLPYLVDDFITGHMASLRLLRKVGAKARQNLDDRKVD